MADKRKDIKGRNLRDGEDQMPDGRYRFRYNDKNGVRQAVYSWRLVSTDKAPAGKRDGLSLREKEDNIKEDHRDGIDGKKAGCRTVPMLQEVRKALIKEKAEQMRSGGCKAEIDGYTDFVFSNKNGYVHNPQTINRAIERIRLACNEQEVEQAKKEHREAVVIPHFSVHNLRHTFCTRFCENETNIKLIQEIMGHSDISTTMNIYAEATEAKKKEAFENLEGKIKIS